MARRWVMTCGALAAMGLVHGAAGCQGACTDVGCGPPVQVNVVAADGPLADGVYQVSVSADGMVTTCEVTVTGESSSFGPNSDCVGDVPLSVDGLGGGIHLWFDRLVYAVEVTVERNGVELGTESWLRTQQDIAVSYPNGEDCAPACRSWAALMEVASSS